MTPQSRCFPALRIVLPLFLLALVTSGASATIRYTVSVEHPEQHIFHVSMEIPEVSGEVIVQMPAWNALYQIRDFSAHVREVDAFAGSNQAAIEKLDKLTWRITGNGTITVRYETYWDEPGPFATQLNAEHAFINPAMILMYVPARRAEEAEIAMSDVPLEWQAAGASLHILESMGRARKLTFTAPSYDALVDAP